MITFSCSNCGKKLQVNDDLAGKRVRCPGCASVVAVPTTELATTASPPGPASLPEPALRPDKPHASGAAAGLSRSVHDSLGETNKMTLADDPSSDATHQPDAATSDRELCAFLSPPQQPDEIGRLGAYRVLQVLGHGGMGVVFKAEDSGLQRLVALKAMLPSLAASASARQRFIREARAAAQLKHDHIVTIHQVGEERGVPFLAMEFLEGESLDDALKRSGKLPLPQVIQIGRQIAEGLAAAHGKGLVHRDIKPGRNIWLERQNDERGTMNDEQTAGSSFIIPHSSLTRVKILDFGLARAASDTSLTQSGAIVGTPAYMAPEQAAGQAVDHRCDLFSLGCVLYRMCTGTTPFTGTNTLAVLRSLAIETPRAPQALDPTIPAALSDLIMGLLAKEPAGRPASVGVVADLLRSMETSRPPERSTAEFFPVKPVSTRRWRPVIAAGLLIFLPLAYFFSGTVIRIATNKGELIIESDDPNIVVTVKDKTATIHDKVKDRRFVLSAGEYDLEVREEGDGGIRFATKKFTITRGGKKTFNARLELENASRAAKAVRRVGNPLDMLRREAIPPYELAAAGGGDPEKAPSELVAVLGDSRLRHWWGYVYSLSFSPDGKAIVSSGGTDGTRIWDATTGNELPFPHTGHLLAAFSPDGKEIASGRSPVAIRNAKTGERRLAFSEGGEMALAFSPDGSRLAVAYETKALKVWDLSTAKLLLDLKGHTGPVTCVAYSRDGKRLVSGSADKTVKVWDAATGTEVLTLTGHRGPVPSNGVAFNPDGTRVVSVSKNEQTHFPEAILWDPATGKQSFTVKGPLNGNINCVAFSPDGKRFATGGGDERISLDVWDAHSGKPVFSLNSRTHPEWDHLMCLAFSPDGRRLASGGTSGRIRLWNANTGEEESPNLNGHGSWPPLRLAISPDGSRVATGGSESTQLWDLAAGKRMFRLDGAFAGGVDFTPDGRRVASTGVANAVLWDTATGKVVRTLEGSSYAGECSFTPDGKRLALAAPNAVLFFDAKTGERLATLEANASRVTFSPDRRWAATATDKTVKIWDALSRRELRTLKAVNAVVGLAFSPDAKRLAAVEYPPRLNVWDAETGETLVAFAHMGQLGGSSAFSPDGKMLALASDAGVLLCEAVSGKQLRTLKLPGPVSSVIFSADGRYLLTANGNGTVYVLRLAAAAPESPADAGPAAPKGNVPPVANLEIKPAPLPPIAAGQPLTPWAWVGQPAALPGVRSWTIDTVNHRGGIQQAVFSPDGRLLATFGPDGGVRVWDPVRGRLVRLLLGHAPRGEVNVDPANFRALAWAPDSKVVASMTGDGAVRLWAVNTGRLLGVLENRFEATSLAWSPDGRTLAVGGAGEPPIHLWEIPSCQEFPPLPKDVRVEVSALSWSPDGKILAAASRGSGVNLIDIAAAKVLRRLPEPVGSTGSAYWDLSWSKDGRLAVASSGIPESVRVWNSASGNLEAEPRKAVAHFSVAWSLDGKLLLCSSLGWVEVRAAGDLKLLRKMVHPRDIGRGATFVRVACSPDNKLVATWETHIQPWPPPNRSTIQFWDPATGKPLRAISGHACEWPTIAWSPDGNSVASGDFAEFGVWLWGSKSGQRLRSLRAAHSGYSPPAFSPDGSMLAVGDGVWALGSGALIKRIPGEVLAGSRAGPIWSSDGKRLAYGSLQKGKGELAIYEAPSGAPIKRWDFNGPIDLAWSRDGKRLAAASRGGKALQVFDADTGKVLREVPYSFGGIGPWLSWSANGNALAYTEAHPRGGGRLVVKIWREEKPAQMLSPAGGSLAWSLDGKLIAVGGQDGRLRVWDTASAKETRTIESGFCTSLAWSADGKTLAATGSTLPVRLFDVATGRQRGILAMLRNEQWLAINAAGHYRGNPRIEEELVYVVQTDAGQETLTPVEFAKKYGWKNDPKQVRLTP